MADSYTRLDAKAESRFEPGAIAPNSKIVLRLNASISAHRVGAVIAARLVEIAPQIFTRFQHRRTGNTDEDCHFHITQHRFLAFQSGQSCRYQASGIVLSDPSEKKVLHSRLQ